jgi:RNA polymerase sigma factor (sigma-70 family)
MNTQKLVEKYIPLANKLAFNKKQTLPKFIDIEELRSAAYLGLTEAANRFDESRGIAFSTFAYPRILGAIIDFVRQMGWGKRNDPKRAYGLDAIEEILAPKDCNLEEMFEVIAHDVDKRTEQILRCYFIDENSMKEVGDKFEISESRISQLITQCKIRIKHNWKLENLKAELAA